MVYKDPLYKWVYINWWFAVGVEHRTRYHSSRKVMMTKLTVVHLIAKAVTSWSMLILGHEDFLPGWSGHTKLTLEALRSNQKTQPQRFCRALGRTWKNWRHRNAVKLTLSIPKKNPRNLTGNFSTKTINKSQVLGLRLNMDQDKGWN